MKNTEVAQLLYEIADFLEIQEVDFKPRSYRRAARNIEALNEDIADVYERGNLEEIDGVGSSIAEKIAEYLETGELEYYSELKADLPIDIDVITRVQGLGPKKAKKLYDALEITDLDELEAAAEAGNIASVEGFGEKSQQNILEHIDLARRGEERMLLGRVFPIVADVESTLASHEVFENVMVVGSFRRRRPTVGDIDILATTTDGVVAMEIFTTQADVVEVLSQGETRASIRISGGLQMDLRLVDETSYGAAKQYFTGSKDHNITTRSRAIERGWKLNEYGLFDENDNRIAGETEAQIYESLDMDWVPPELREDTGEVTAAVAGTLPDLVDTTHIRGDLQMHTLWSDGSNTVLEMAEKADALGHEYILITDHGPSLQVASGLSQDEFEEQRTEINEANDQTDVTVLHGIEANVVEDGLDVSRGWLEHCDGVVMALHDRPNNPTDLVVNAMRDYPVDIFAHPQNRLLNERPPIEYDFERVIEMAEAENVALEINCLPNRLDLDWALVKEYRNRVDYVISTDAHVTSNLENIHLGVSQARRGWCERSDILNTLPKEKLLDRLN